MTISLLMPDGLALTAQQERQAKAPQHGGGSGRPLGGRSGFRVGTPSNVLTATSTTWTLGPCAIEIDPGASVDQGMYGWANSSNFTGTGAQGVQAGDSTYDRKDIVYIQINDPSAGDGTASLSYAPQYLAGAATATPTAPDLPPRSFLVGTITVPKAGSGSPTVQRNPAVYVAAGAPLPVSSVTERDALTVYDGLSVQRLDLKGRPIETWDAAASVWAGVTTPSAGSGWALTGTMTRRGPQVAAAFMCTYSGGAFGIGTTFIKALTLSNPGYVPNADVFGYVLVLSSTNVVRADGAFNINPSGELYIRMFSGSYTIQPTDKFYISANWNV